jgi:hydroxymethylglutaryl-CoA reductase
VRCLLKNYWNSDEKLQQLHDEFIENTITNFYIPLELPLIFSNGKYSTIPWPLKKAQWLQLPQKQLNFGLRAAALRLPSNTKNRAGSFYVQGRCFQIKLVFCSTKINFSQKLNRLPQICKKRGGGI